MEDYFSFLSILHLFKGPWKESRLGTGTDPSVENHIENCISGERC